MAQQTTASHDFSGTWHCCYWFPSNTHAGEDTSEYDVTAEQTGHQLTLQSLPTKDGSYIFVRLLVDGAFAAGSWFENTAPEGEFKGMIYSGVVQLLVAEDGRSMRGKWVGAGRDLARQQPDVYEGRWQLRRLP